MFFVCPRTVLEISVSKPVLVTLASFRSLKLEDTFLLKLVFR